MNQRASVVIEIILFMVLVVVTSAVVLLLVRSGVIMVKAENEDISVLNAEFLPYERSGTVVMKEFEFCTAIDEQFHCITPTTHFTPGSEVHFLYRVDSSSWNGDIALVKNYRITGPDKVVLLDVDERNNYVYQEKSTEKVQTLTFKDYFMVSPLAPAGEYTLELVLSNPLLDKKVTVTKNLEIGS